MIRVKESESEILHFSLNILNFHANYALIRERTDMFSSTDRI